MYTSRKMYTHCSMSEHYENRPKTEEVFSSSSFSHEWLTFLVRQRHTPFAGCLDKNKRIKNRSS